MPAPDANATALVDALRDDLVTADYTVERVLEILGPGPSAALHREQAIPGRLVLADSDDPVATMVRFFTLGDTFPLASLDAAFPALRASGLETLGLAVPADAGLRAACDLRPYGDENSAWWLASDLSELATGSALPTDHVLGIGGASTTLARWTPRRPVTTALDLGTGCGVQAVHLTEHAQHVVVSDLATRALEFVRFNAALNQLSPEVVEGSMLEPVRGRRFDLVVSNPPFVITPRREGVPDYEYRDGGAVGDAVVHDLVRSVGEHLEPGGIAQFLGNWEMRADHGFEALWAEWLDGTGLDAWVVQREVQDPYEYAELWARDGGAGVTSPEYAAMYAAWLDDFAARGVESIGFGIVTLQRPERPREPFVDLMDERGPVAPAMGPTIDAGLVARTWLARASDDDVLDAAWCAADDVTEERHTKPGADDPSIIMIRQGGGLALSIQADTVLAAFMSVCDGSLSARTALVAIASLVGVPEDEVIAGTLPLLRKLIANGLIERVEP